MNALSQLRVIGFLEGLSFVVLLFVAMPLKYMAGLPTAVRITGSLHGLLFLLFAVSLFRAYGEYGWPVRRAAWGFLASLVPFGTFVFDRSLREEIAQLRAAEQSESAARAG